MMWKVLAGLLLTLPAGAYAVGVVVGPSQPPPLPGSSVSTPTTASSPSRIASRSAKPSDRPGPVESIGSDDEQSQPREPGKARKDNGPSKGRGGKPSELPEPTATRTPVAEPTESPSEDPTTATSSPSPQRPSDSPTPEPSDSTSDGTSGRTVETSAR